MSFITDLLSQIIIQTIGPVPQITPQELYTAAQRLAQDRCSQETTALAAFCHYFSRAYQNFDFDMQTNGEDWLLEKLIPFQPQVVFDIGANFGDWSAAAHVRHPSASIHAFEIIPGTYEKLISRIPAGERWFHPNPFGLSDAPGLMGMNIFEHDAAVSTFTEYPHGKSQKRLCHVYSGDEYVASKGLTHIDLLKIDVEGAEHLVLRGFQKSIDRGLIDLIQFEYGKYSILTRFLLADYYQFLESRGFVIGKLFPNGVAFRPYSLDEENFLGPNYIACRQTRQDLVQALRWP